MPECRFDKYNATSKTIPKVRRRRRREGGGGVL